MEHIKKNEHTAFLPVWIEPWVKQALSILLAIINMETERARAESERSDSSVQPEALLAHCIALGMAEWRALANEICPQHYSTARFVTACMLFEKNALYEIQSQLDQTATD